MPDAAAVYTIVQSRIEALWRRPQGTSVDGDKSQVKNRYAGR